MSKKSKRMPAGQVNGKTNEFCHILYDNSRRNKIYRTEDILIHFNYPACEIYNVNTKKVLHKFDNIDIGQVTLSEYGNEYAFDGQEANKRNKAKPFNVRVITDSDGLRNHNGEMLFTGFDLADAFSSDFKNYLGNHKS